MVSSSRSSLLFVSGSTRKGSINSAVITTTARLLPSSWCPTIYPGLAQLPHFNPDLEEAGPPASVTDLRSAIAATDAVLFCTPEYAGAMPGALKNLLEWTIGDTVMSDKPVSWINPSTAPGRSAGTYATLRTVLSYTGANVVEAACCDILVARSQVGENGVIDDPAIQEQIRAAIAALTAGR